MTIVKNIAAGPRGIYLASGKLLMLEPGQISGDVELAKGERDAADPSWFRFDEEAEPANAETEATDIDLDSLTPAARQVLEAASAEFEHRWTEIVAERGAALSRAESAEARLDVAIAELDYLRAKLDKFDPDGDGRPGGAVGGEAASDESVKSAIELLDPTKDEDWTAAGLPAVDAVAALAGGKVTRAQIESLAPGLTRETAAKG